MPELTAIARYLVKSCRGETLTEAVVEPWGLVGDRRWMLVGPEGKFVTARTDPSLVLVRPTSTDEGLVISAPAMADLVVPFPDPAAQTPVTVWSSTLTAAWAGRAAQDWFTELLGRPVRLVYLDDPTRRSADPQYAADADRVSFADGYPLLLTTEASLAALNERIAERAMGPLASMARFRPNVVVSGTSPWEEDDWRRVRIGSVQFRAVKGCARCVLTTVDPDTAAKGKEPIASLATLRRFDSGVWFGINLVPDLAADAMAGSPPPRIRVGDPVEILDSVPVGAGPLR